jgi:hypothetical protein
MDCELVFGAWTRPIFVHKHPLRIDKYKLQVGSLRNDHSDGSTAECLSYLGRAKLAVTAAAGSRFHGNRNDEKGGGPDAAAGECGETDRTVANSSRTPRRFPSAKARLWILANQFFLTPSSARACVRARLASTHVPWLNFLLLHQPNLAIPRLVYFIVQGERWPKLYFIMLVSTAWIMDRCSIAASVWWHTQCIR